MFRCQRSRFHKREFWNSQSVNNSRVPEVLETFGFRGQAATLQIGSTSAHLGKSVFFYFILFFTRCFQFGPRVAKYHRDSQEQNPSQSNASNRTTSVKVCNKMPSYGPDGSCSCVSRCEFLFNQALESQNGKLAAVCHGKNKTKNISTAILCAWISFLTLEFIFASLERVNSGCPA